MGQFGYSNRNTTQYWLQYKAEDVLLLGAYVIRNYGFFYVRIW